ncbi:hypothetical protein [Mesorhizobium sp.]|uniref:hypothetical protein n=1 Tax=Mesorhizobium sp. TaxID=1871066 RepID=UPI000FEA6F35|nr:hypothetical protein [Mesorhizobium sp.]RWE44198.1 MAG: hypothetical protein EOS80_19860 [Mesorhizobium sp.]
MSKARKPKFIGPDVGISDVLNDKQLLEVVRNILQPGFEATVWSGAMMAKQMALSALERPNTLTAHLSAALEQISNYTGHPENMKAIARDALKAYAERKMV